MGLKVNDLEMSDQFKKDLESFFNAYPASDLKLCLQNIYTGYLGSELCTLNDPQVRGHDGNMLMDFMIILDSQNH